MVIPDALEDSRFRTNPLVLGFPYVRFYGGASIIIDGIKVGTLCLIDSEPRAGFTKEQQEILIDIADCIAGLMIDRRAAQLENRHDSIQMHQSILSILQEPLHRMRDSASKIEMLLHSVSKMSDDSTNKVVGAKAERAEELVEVFQKDVTYFQKLLDTSLRSLTRVIVNPETHETMSLTGRWTPRRTQEAQANAHNNTHQQHQQQHLGILLPFEKLQWHIALNELLDHYRLPQASICCENDIDETMSVMSHPDLLLLCVASVLGYVAQASPNAADAVERIHTSYVAAHSKVVVDIHSRVVSSSLVDQQESALILNSVRTVLSWVSGSLRLLPDEGIMRVEVDCELVSARGTAGVVSTNGPASGQRSTRDSFVSDATYVPNGQDVDNEPLSVTPVYHPVTSSSSPQPQEQQQHKHRTMISALARNLWHAILLSSKVQPVALDSTDADLIVKTTPTTSSKSAMTMGLVHNKVVPEKVLSDKHSLQLLGVVPGSQ